MMTCREMTLGEVFPRAADGVGIFSYLDAFAVPWKGKVESSDLDLQYHLLRSDEKIVTSLVTKLVGDQSPITEEVYQKLASSIWSRFSVKWTKQYETLFFEYNPIENYRMEEKEDITSKGTSSHKENNTRTDNLTHTKESNNTDTESGSVTKESNSGGTIKNSSKSVTKNNDSVYAFNSQSAVPSDQGSSETDTSSTQENDLTGSDNESRDLKFGHDIHETLTDTGNVSDDAKGSSEHDDTTNRGLTRSGNIGVTTSQQMIESERKLYSWDFFLSVFEDLDEVLTLPIF